MTFISEEERKKWVAERVRMAQEQNVTRCSYCGLYSGVFRLTFKKFILPKSKKKVYICQDCRDKVNELDNLIWALEHPEESGLNRIRKEKKEQEEQKRKKDRNKKIIIYSILSIILLSCIYTIIQIWR